MWGGGLPTGGESASRGSAYGRGCLHAGWGVCIQGGLHPGEGWADPPPELEKRVISILLECFLFEYSFHTFKYKATCLESHSSPF